MSTPTRPARRYAKEVGVDTRHYTKIHGRAPRGYGEWAFAPSYAAEERSPAGTPLPADAAREQLHQTARSYRGTYAQARAQAQRDAATLANSRHDPRPLQALTLATLP